MGFFKRTLRFTKDVAMIPVDIAWDTTTFGVLDDAEKEPRTVERLRKLSEDIQEASDWLDED